MPDQQSVTAWLQALQAGDSGAADALWRRYFEKLVRLARQRLGDSPRRMADEQDVAMSVFKSLCEGVERGEFERLNDREDLWRLITTITGLRAISGAQDATQRGGRKAIQACRSASSSFFNGAQ